MDEIESRFVAESQRAVHYMCIKLYHKPGCVLLCGILCMYIFNVDLEEDSRLL